MAAKISTTGNVSPLRRPKLARRAAEPASPKTQSRPNSILIRVPYVLDPDQRNAMIAEAAYYRAERRGFESGFELEDWLTAENEIDGALTGDGIVGA